MPPLASPYPGTSFQNQHLQNTYINSAQNWGNTQFLSKEGCEPAHSQANSQNSNEGNSSGSASDHHKRRYLL